MTTMEDTTPKLQILQLYHDISAKFPYFSFDEEKTAINHSASVQKNLKVSKTHKMNKVSDNGKKR